jgi:hypothetical protein
MTIYTSHSSPSNGKTTPRGVSVIVRIAECFERLITTANHPTARKSYRDDSRLLGCTSMLQISRARVEEGNDMGSMRAHASLRS